jgi:alpha-mannosidase
MTSETDRPKGEASRGLVSKPTVHLICNAHLDPVWQWRWEEGASEALATFKTAVRLIREHPRLIFNHNEAVLYRWVERLDPNLFEDIRRLVSAGRWCVSGGWFLQPDLNLPGTESLIRQVVFGRSYFAEKFGAAPRVAYNFDSFGHTGGLPQILTLAGYRMYIHMRPQAGELDLPSDLYRWRGVDGSEIVGLRISVGLYHTEPDNITDRLRAGVAKALELERDVPVFWGLGDHGGGATHEDLKTIDDFAARESRVRIVHSTTESLGQALEEAARTAPVVEGDIQRVFTGCYTSLSRVKRRSRVSLGELLRAEVARSASWWALGQEFPGEKLERAWRGHLFNDFHDVLTGTCTEPAERDALDLYGRVSTSARALSLEAAAALAGRVRTDADVPVTVLRALPVAGPVPVEVECMLDYRPRLDRPWHLTLLGLDGREIPSQEEQPESLLPYNGWRRKVCFMAEGKGAGASFYNLVAREGEPSPAPAQPALKHSLDRRTGLVHSLEARGIPFNILRGALLEPIVIEDPGDSWGAGVWNYRRVLGRFKLESKVGPVVDGPIRRITESVWRWGRSRIVYRVLAYAGWPVIELRLRVHWAEERQRLKLRLPTALESPSLLAEVPGGAITRPADGEEHVHGSWLFLKGMIRGAGVGLGLANSGQPGFDFLGGELRLSVLRSAAYCHDQGFPLGEHPRRKFMDQGVHDVRLLVTAGEPRAVLESLPFLADWLNAPPAAYAHLPFGGGSASGAPEHATSGPEAFLSVGARNVRLLACRPSRDEKALIIRLQEATGSAGAVRLGLGNPRAAAPLEFRPFEIKTVRVERSGAWREADIVDET